MCAKTIKINEGFICCNCGYPVPPARKTCRNHCLYCLYSMHRDSNFPGDRSSECCGLMEPIGIVKTGKGYMLVHRCMKCGHISHNQVMEDDCWEKVIELTLMNQQ